MVTQQKEVYYRFGIWNLDLPYKTKITAMVSHLPSLGWLPSNPRMVTHQKDLLYTLEKRHLDITHQTKAR